METETKEFREPTFAAGARKASCKEGVPLIPKGRRIVVVQNKFVQRSVIYIPDTAQAKPTTGVVVAIGPDVEEDFVQLDELVIFSLYAGVPLNIVGSDGEATTYLMLTPDEIAGTLVVDVDKLKVNI